MLNNNVNVIQKKASILATNKVLRNTYLLLGLNFLFSAFVAYIGIITNAQPMNILFMIIGMYGLMFLTQRLRNSPWGLVSIFAFTGFLGYTLGPILNYYLHAFSNGSELIMTSLGATGIIFLTLSGYVLTTRKDFSYLNGFLFVAMITVLLMMIGGIFFNIPALHLVISSLFVLISSGMILFQTSAIINGGERNYIMATISLFVSLYNLFLSLLHILGALSGRD